LYKISDLAVACGASIITNIVINELVNINDDTTNELIIPEEYIGSARSISIAEMFSTVINPKGDESLILDKINEVETYIKLNEKFLSEEIINFHKLRITTLNQDSSLILVGGGTEVERNNNRDKLVDCLNSCKTATENGLLMGGGNTYLLAKSLFNLIFKYVKKEIKIFHNKCVENDIGNKDYMWLIIDLYNNKVNLELHFENKYQDKNRYVIFNLSELKDSFKNYYFKYYTDLIEEEGLKYSGDSPNNFIHEYHEKSKQSFEFGTNLFIESLLDLIRILYANNKKYSGERVIEEYSSFFNNNSDCNNDENKIKILSYGFDLNISKS
jgi:hypothetical protein